MKQVTHFIEVYAAGLETKNTAYLPISYLETSLETTASMSPVLTTVAIFKIYLKN